MSININFETKNIIRFFVVATVFVAAIFGLYRMYGALLLIAISLFFALALNPAVSFLSRYMPWKKRGPAIAIVFITVAAAILFLFASIIPPVAKETSSFLDSLPETFNNLTAENSQARNFVRKYHLEGTISAALEGLKDYSQSLGNKTLASVGSVTTSFYNIVTVIIMTILMLTGGGRLLKAGASMLYRDKARREHHVYLVKKMYGAVTGYAIGQVSVAMLGALFSLGALLLLKVPYALPLALIVFVFALIPMIGTTLAAVIVSLLTLILKDPTTALIMIVFFVIYQQIENVTIQPIVQAKTSQLPPLIVFIAVILGIGLIGPIGGLFAIPVASCIKILLNDYIENRDKVKPDDKPSTLIGKVKRKVAKAVAE